MKFGIAAQLVVPFVAICAGIVAILGFGLLSTVSTILSESLDEKSRCLVRTTVNELRGPLLLGEDLHAQSILATARKSDHDLSYIIVDGADGSTLCSDVGPNEQPLPFNASLEKEFDEKTDVIRRQGTDARTFEMVAPIDVSGERAGLLRMGFSSARIDHQLQNAQCWIVCMGAVSLILGSTAYVLLISRSILQPLKTMVRTSARIAMGDVGETIDVKRHDEIGELLNAMNQMVVYLRHMSQAADAIAGGDLTVNVQPRSSADHFGNALQQMVASLNGATTELLRREAEARKLAAIVEYSHDAIISVQPDGTVISWNAGAETLLGYTAEQIIGKAVDEIFPDQAAISQLHSLLGACPDKFELADGDGGPQSPETIETNLIRRDGSRVEISMTVSPVAGDEAGSVSFSMIARDVTHKRLVERRLREFYSMISHELRTPLTSIRGALALIAQGVVPAESDNGVKLIQLAQSSCIRLVRLINHILDMRKIEDGNLHLELQSIPADQLLRLSVEEMEALAYERGVRLKIGSACKSEVLVDSDRMVQVLTNLISNAVKYSDSGQEVTIAVVTADGGRRLRFKVTDHGDGISEDHQSKLFRQFQQIDSSDSRAKEGSGLGLFICKALVEQHGGKIGVESEVGAGSTFWFEIAATPPAPAMQVDCGGKQQSSTSNV